MKIINLKSENVKNLKAIEIHPEGNTIVVTGKNGAGKSSVLDSILYAFSGRHIPDEPIRQGQKKAKVVVDCGEFQITRSFSESGNRLKIESKGVKKSSPQSFLDRIVGKISFDPMVFITKPEREQAGILMNLIGVDVELMDAKEKELEIIRRDRGRLLRNAESAFDCCPHHPDAPDAQISVKDLYAELDAARQHNAEIERQQEAFRALKVTLDKTEREIAFLKEQLKEKEKLLSEYQDKIDTVGMKIMNFEEMDLEPINAEIQNADQINRQVEQNAEKERLRQESIKAGTAHTEAENDLKKAREERVEAIKSAKFPIEGLSFGEKKIIFNGVPLKQLSSAEQIKVSLAVSMALNPKMRVLRISDGSLLDSESMGIIRDMADDQDYQVWIERVEDGDKTAIYIEDGEVK